ncbi:unnamed protein product [Blumeria hordei]|uniref:Uncharacterized protein n=1 Tax=Blumeria hordei TaxID=2867405 RepID=A0A383UZI9_BLUHO|nr:unnamed protein product [Blumeria hordei]SZF05172.1 unnamed protein product [Blumeria hordei]
MLAYLSGYSDGRFFQFDRNKEEMIKVECMKYIIITLNVFQYTTRLAVGVGSTKALLTTKFIFIDVIREIWLLLDPCGSNIVCLILI